MRYVVASVVLCALVVSSAGRAHAQEGNNSALAEQLFNQARELVKANQWAEACPKFEASLRYDPVLGTRLNLATCYERVGKLASAWGLYRESIELAKKAGDTKRAEFAQKQAAALEPRLPKLAISAPANPPPGLVVMRDNTPVAAAELNVALYIDPGAHVVTASAPGFETYTQSVTLVEGKSETIAIPVLVAKPVTPDVEPPKDSTETVDEPESTGRSSTRRYVGIGLGGAGVAAIAVGLVFGAKASSAFNDAKALCGDDLACSSMETFEQDKKLVQEARSNGTKATVFVIGGLAAAAAGVVVFLTAPRGPETSTATARIVPVPHDGGAGLAITGIF